MLTFHILKHVELTKLDNTLSNQINTLINQSFHSTRETLKDTLIHSPYWYGVYVMDNQQVVAFSSVVPYTSGYLIEFYTLCVDPKYRRQGIVGQLIYFTIDYFKSFPDTKLQLVVLKDNLIAQRAYHKYGFVIDRVGHLKFTDIGLIMVCTVRKFIETYEHIQRENNKNRY